MNVADALRCFVDCPKCLANPSQYLYVPVQGFIAECPRCGAGWLVYEQRSHLDLSDETEDE